MQKENKKTVNVADEKNPITGQLSEDDRLYELKILKASWDMYERTKKETKERRETATDKNGNKLYKEKDTKKTMELIETMQDDIKRRYLAFGGKMEDLTAPPAKKTTKKANNDRMKLLRELLEKEKNAIDENEDYTDKEEDYPIDKASVSVPDITEDEEDLGLIEPSQYLKIPTINGSLGHGNKVEPVKDGDENVSLEGSPNYGEDDDISVTVNMANARGKNIKYDVIPLPSRGQCYKSKMAKVPVGYLTAYDENLIISPNMYRDGTFLDHILKAKLMTNRIDPMDLVPGDRDAIILWLRASGYGTDFPVNAVDNATGKEFQTKVDLTKLKYKKFKLKGDEDGYFDFTLPVSGDMVKFKFLTIGDIKRIEKMEEDEVAEVRKTRAVNLIESISEIVEGDESVEAEKKLKLANALSELKSYADGIDAKVDKYSYSHSVTNKLAASIVSINGVTDRPYIDEHVMYMNVRDSSALRKYIVENEPGIDFNIEVERPESLGGGSVSMFLTIDQFIFLTVA